MSDYITEGNKVMADYKALKRCESVNVSTSDYKRALEKLKNRVKKYNSDFGQSIALVKVGSYGRKHNLIWSDGRV